MTLTGLQPDAVKFLKFGINDKFNPSQRWPKIVIWCELSLAIYMYIK